MCNGNLIKKKKKKVVVITWFKTIIRLVKNSGQPEHLIILMATATYLPHSFFITAVLYVGYPI